MELIFEDDVRNINGTDYGMLHGVSLLCHYFIFFASCSHLSRYAHITVVATNKLQISK